MGEYRPFSFPEGSALLNGLIVDVRYVGRDGRKVQVLEAEAISKSIAARNTENKEKVSPELSLKPKTNLL